MEPRQIQYRKGRVGIETLEPRIAPTILMVNGGGNTPQGEGRANGNFPPGQFPSVDLANAPGRSNPNELLATNPSND
jgi:hypothetical protein